MQCSAKSARLPDCRQSQLGKCKISPYLLGSSHNRVHPLHDPVTHRQLFFVHFIFSIEHLKFGIKFYRRHVTEAGTQGVHSTIVFSVGNRNYKYCKRMNYLCVGRKHKFNVTSVCILFKVRSQNCRKCKKIFWFDSKVGLVDSTLFDIYYHLGLDFSGTVLQQSVNLVKHLRHFCAYFSRRPGRAQPWQWGRGWGLGCGPGPPAQSPPAPQRRTPRPSAHDAWE